MDLRGGIARRNQARIAEISLIATNGLQSEFPAETGSEIAGGENFLEQQATTLEFAIPHAAVVFSGAGDVDGARKGQGFEWCSPLPHRIAQDRMAVGEEKVVGSRFLHALRQVFRLAAHNGGTAAQKIEIVAGKGEPGSVVVNVSAFEIPAGRVGMFGAPGGESAADAIVGVDKHQVAGHMTAGFNAGALELAEFVHHAAVVCRIRLGKIFFDDGEVGMLKDSFGCSVAGQDDVEFRRGLRAEGTQGPDGQAGDMAPVLGDSRALERDNENQHAISLSVGVQPARPKTIRWERF